MTTRPDEFTIRPTTRLELGLVVALIINVAAIVGFAVTMSSKVDAIITNMNQLREDVKMLNLSATDVAVLRYRVGQLESQITNMQRDRSGP